MAKKRTHIYVSGRVQGVFYRQSTLKVAADLEVTGWVKNLPDGRVEAVLEGDDDAVDTMIEWCKKGPTTANVRSLEKYEEEYKGEFEKFRVKYD